MRSSRRLVSSKRRGIALTIEMVLLITAIIVLSIVAYFGISKAVFSQATSQKSTLAVVRAEAYGIGTTATATTGPVINTIAVSIWVQNVGADPVTITMVGVSTGSDTRVISYSTNIRPGETRVISFVTNIASISPNTSIYVFVRTQDGYEVGTATRVALP